MFTIKSQKGFTLIEMMIISNAQNQRWLNYNVCRD
ncbi:prepilin-type N-terminal cleavage/methylation domain-containing protein [Sporosarcina sp. ITBMC105]